jgi:uncharacterized protein (TIGR02145 family)
MRRNFLVYVLSALTLSGIAEGTKEIMPNQVYNARILCSTEGIRDPFALYNGNADYRLYIHIQDYTQEAIYFGLGQIRRSNNQTATPLTYRVHRPDGTIIFEKQTPTVGQTGFIDTYAEAIAGPDYLSASGYDADSVYAITVGVNGDYFMTFQLPNNTYRTFEYFDITVVNTTAHAKIDGRVFSKSWQISTYEEGIVGFLGYMFAYSNDSIVTRFNPNGFDGRHFSITCNESGCYQVGMGMPANQARKSAAGRHTYPQYKVFLNDPDILVYPSGTLGSLVQNTPVVQTTSFCNLATMTFTFEVTATGSGELVLNCSLLGPPYMDRLISQTVLPGWNTFTWDGFDGDIPPNAVPNGSQISFTLTYINGMTHLPLYDVENNDNGFTVDLIRPPGPEPPFNWDDSGLTPAPTPGPTLSPPGGCISSITPCHLWTNNGGDNRSMNTWWYVANTSTAPVDITYIRTPPAPGPITGPASVCPGSSGHIYWINTEPNSDSYVWGYTGTGATITPVNDTTVSVGYANNATPGNLTVAGVNAECGQGPPQTKAITIYPAPVVSLASFTPVCIDTPPFTLSGGSPAGGTYTILGVPVTTFNPATYGTGSHQVTYTYTDQVTSCTASDQKSLVVNSLPVVTLASLAAVCVNSPPYPLTGGNPTGGTYSGPGVSGGSTFTPSVAGAGTHTITYTYTDANSCTNSATGPLTVFPLTSVNLAPLAAVCVNVTPFPLTGGSPPGGTYSGPGVTAGIFNPAAAGAGVHTIIYSFTDANGCTNSDSEPQTVNPLPGAAGTITGSATVCQAAVNVPYSTTPITNATSYNWLVAPPAAGSVTGSGTSVTVTWAALYTGTAQITVRGVNNCGEGTVSAPFDVLVRPNPSVTFTRCFDSVTIATAKPIVLKGGIPLGGTYSGTGISGGIFYPALAGLGVRTITYSFTNMDGCTKTAATTITVQNPGLWNCGSTLTDRRDGKQYPTVLLGSQCWMAANLNYGTRISGSMSQRDNCINEKYCFNDDPARCTQGSVQYQWDELMAYGSAEGAQGLCPPGWHIPSEPEWIALFNNYINNGFAASALKVTGYSGFNALLSGFQVNNTAWVYGPTHSVLRSTMFWSSTLHGTGKAWAHGMNQVVADPEYTPSASFYPSNRNNAFSVRCLKD